MATRISKSRKEALVLHLQEAQKELRRLNRKTAETEGVDILGVLVTFLKTAREALASRASKRLPQFLKEIREGIDYCHNAVESALEALEEGDLEVDDLRSVKAQVGSRLHDLLRVAVALEDERVGSAPVKLKEGLSRSMEWNDGLNAAMEQAKARETVVVDTNDPNQAESDRKATRTMEQAKGVLAEVQHFKDLLPNVKTSRKKFQVLKLPVAPVFEGFINREDLAQAGFDIRVMETYVILKGQPVVGINQRYLKKRGLTPLNYLKRIQHLLTERLGFSFVPSETTATHEGTGFSYIWLIPESQYNHMVGTDRSMKIRGWGLGF